MIDISLSCFSGTLDELLARIEGRHRAAALGAG